MADIPETVTETVRADELTPGRTIFVATSTWAEKVERVEVTHGYVNVYTDQTICYQWPAETQIRALAGGAR